MKVIKKLSEFKDEKGIEVAAQVLAIIMDIFASGDPEKYRHENPAKMFGLFMAHSPAEMQRIFAILAEEDPDTYHCDGAEAIMNMMVLANDPVIVSLFTSQRQKGDAKSSASASVNTEE